MSSICLCMTEIKDENERAFCQSKMEKIAKAHGRGIAFSIDWSEPIVEHFEGSRMIVSLSDRPDYGNCERWCRMGRRKSTENRT